MAHSHPSQWDCPTNQLLEVMLDALITGANVGFIVDRVTIFNLPGASNNGGTNSILGYAAISPRSTNSTPVDQKVIREEI